MFFKKAVDQRQEAYQKAMNWNGGADLGDGKCDYGDADLFCGDRNKIHLDKKSGIVATNVEGVNDKPYFLMRRLMERGNEWKTWTWRLYYHKKVTMDGLIGIMAVGREHNQFVKDIYSDKRVAAIFVGYNSMWAWGSSCGGAGKFGGTKNDFIADLKLTLAPYNSGQEDSLEYYCSWAREDGFKGKKFVKKFKGRGDVFRSLCIFYPHACCVQKAIPIGDFGRNLSEYDFAVGMPYTDVQVVNKMVS